MSRTRSGLVVSTLAVSSLVAVARLAPAPAGAASPRPLLKAPFACGTQWGASTYSGHGKAIDFNTMKGAETDFGKPVLASAAGKARRGHDSGHGNFVVVDHGRGWSTLYAHLNRVTIKNPILQGEKIGTVGRTGNVTGSHLHYQQRYRGKGVLPLRFDGKKVKYAQSTPGVRLRSTNCVTSPTGGLTLLRPSAGRFVTIAGRVTDKDAGRRSLTYRVYLYAKPGSPGAVRVHTGPTRIDGTFAKSVRATRTGAVAVYLYGNNAPGTRGADRLLRRYVVRALA